MGVKAWLGGIAIVAVLAAVGAFALHYNKLVNDNVIMAGSIGKLEITLGESQEDLTASIKRIDAFAEALEEQARVSREMMAIQEDANKIITELENVFDRHDLEKLLAAKPNAVIKRINRGTVDRLRMLECSAAGSCADDSRDESANDPAIAGPSTSETEGTSVPQ